MDEGCLPRQVFDCSLARPGAEDGRVEQPKLRQGHRNSRDFSGMYSSAIRGCHEEGPLPGHTKLIPWPEIRAAAAERAFDRQAWRDAIKKLAALELKKPRQVKRMTRSCAHRGGSPGLVNGALCIDCDLAAEDMAVIALEKASEKSKENGGTVCGTCRLERGGSEQESAREEGRQGWCQGRASRTHSLPWPAPADHHPPPFPGYMGQVPTMQACCAVHGSAGTYAWT
eukprot:349836-Chlamydomonas_euryale.AAC.5